MRIAAVCCGALLLSAPCSTTWADLESLYEPSLEWLVDSCDGIAIAQSELTAQGDEVFTDLGRGRTMRKYRVTAIIKDHDRITIRKVFSGLYTPGKIGDRTMIFLRTRGSGMVADHVINLSTPREVGSWQGEPSRLVTQPLMAFDKTGAFVTTEKELLRRVKQRMKGPDRVPEDCDYFAVEARQSFYGGFYIRPQTPRLEFFGYDIDLHILIPPEPEYRERFQLEVLQNRNPDYMEKIVKALQENFGVKDPLSQRYELPFRSELGQIFAKRNTAQFNWKVTRDYTEDMSRYSTHFQLSPDGMYMVEYSDSTWKDCIVRRLDDRREVLRQPRSTMWSLGFSPSSRYIFWGSSVQKVSIYDIDQEKVTLSFPGLINAGASFSADERLFATVVVDKEDEKKWLLSVWDIQKSEQVLLEPITLPYVQFLGFSPSGQYLIIHSSQNLHFIDYADKSLKTRFSPTGEDRSSAGTNYVNLSPQQFEISADDQRLAYFTTRRLKTTPEGDTRCQTAIHVREITTAKELKLITLPLDMTPRRLRFIGGGEYLVAEFDQPVDGSHAQFALLYSVDSDKVQGDAITWEYNH